MSLGGRDFSTWGVSCCEKVFLGVAGSTKLWAFVSRVFLRRVVGKHLGEEFRAESPSEIRLGRTSLSPLGLDFKNWHRKNEHFYKIRDLVVFIPKAVQKRVHGPSLSWTFNAGTDCPEERGKLQTALDLANFACLKIEKRTFWKSADLDVFCPQERPEERGNYPSPLDSQCRHRVSRGEG